MNPNSLYVRVLLVLIALVILLTFLNRDSRRTSEGSWVPSSYNPVGAGNMALFTTLGDLRWPVERWREPLSRLSLYGTGNTLVITRSQVGRRLAFSEDEISILAAWVKNGNRLILLGALDHWDDTRQLLREFGFAIAPNAPSSVGGLLHPVLAEERPLTLTSPAGDSLTIPAASPLPSVPTGTRVLYQNAGAPYLAEIPFGFGSIVCGSSALLLDNETLSKSGNLAEVLRLLAPSGKVPAHLFFEEGHHGYATIFALVNLLGSPALRFGAMLALLGLATFFGSSLVRFGAVIPMKQSAGRSNLEFLDSVADLYQRADLRNAQIAFLYRETRLGVLRRLNLPATATPEQISAQLGKAYPHLPRWKKLAHRFESKEHIGGLPPSGWFRLARELIEVKNALA